MWGDAHVRKLFIISQIQKPAPNNKYRVIDAKHCFTDDSSP